MTRNLGFPSDKIVVLNNNDAAIQENGLAFKNALLKNSNIITASYSSGAPGSNIASKGNFTPEGGNSDDEVMLQILNVDYDFLKTYGLKMVDGRFFSQEYANDITDSYILNEAAVKLLNSGNPLLTRITRGSGDDKDAKFCSIVGVMQNFNYRSLVKAVDPIIFRLRPNGGNLLSLQLNENELVSTMNYIKETAAAFSPAYPFDYFFTKDRFERYYRNIKILGNFLGIFAGLAVLISCIGILGLVSFSTGQKAKEIGIRKVLGASVSGIVFMLCKEFVKWAMISNLIAWPLAYLAMSKWLNGFAYRIDFGYMIIAVTFAISIVITIMTVSYHSIKAAIANPVNSLRSE
jgi:putative ABC transport system permease protein